MRPSVSKIKRPEAAQVSNLTFLFLSFPSVFSAERRDLFLAAVIKKRRDIMGVEDESEDVDTQEAEEGELRRFLACDALSRQADPLVWWKEKEDTYPCVSKVAKRLLSVPATSTPSE